MAEATDKKAAEAPAAPTYPVERLIAESDGFLGVPSHVTAGALHGSRKKELTLAEAGAAIEAWNSREVTVDNQEGR